MCHDNHKVTVKLINGSEVTELDGSEGVCVLIAAGGGVEEYGIADMETRGGLLAAALIGLPDELFEFTVEFARGEREKEKQPQSKDNLVMFRRK